MNNSTHPVDDYATKVASGELVTNKWVKLACLRHQRDAEKYGRNPSDGLWFSEKAAQGVIDFFPTFLQFYEGDFDGVPFTLTPSQAFIVGSLFGWKKGQFRRFKTAYIEQAKGQGKSPLAAGVGLFCLVADGESGAEIYSAAVTREQAGILFRDAKAFVEKSPSLRKRLNVGVANIDYTDRNSFFRPISSERRGLDGKRPHVCLIDEIHEHPNDIVVRKMGAGRKTRRQPIIFEITNALALDTPIPTPSGWTTMGDIQPGDRVFDDKGDACNVTAATDIMAGHKCYRITFDDGSEIVSDAGHLWETTQRRGCQPREEYLNGLRQNGNIVCVRRKRGEPIPVIRCACGCGGEFPRFDSSGRSRTYISGHNMEARTRLGIRTTEQIKETVRYQRSANHRVRVAGALVLPEIFLPVHPYVLGCWLGDGNSKDAAIVVSEQDMGILENIKAAGVTSGPNQRVFPHIGLFGIGTTGKGRRDNLCSSLRRLGVLRNKHIPQIYLRSSIQQRLSLLQGLMDTDGHIAPRTGRCVFTQHREDIVRQVAELVSSLGIKRTVLHSVAKLNGKCFDRWDVFFHPPWAMKIFGLERKQKHNKARHSRIRMSASHHIESVDEVPSVPVRCISVDSQSNLFLAGRSMIPTHNSGYDRNSICYQHHEHTEKILEGVIQDDTWFGYMTGLDVCEKCAKDGKTVPQDGCPDCDDWRDENVWIKANPNLPYLGEPFREYLRMQVEEAKSMAAQENIVKRLNFCIWTESITKWLPADSWSACAEHDLHLEDFAGQSCYYAFDLANKIDISALLLIFNRGDELVAFGRYYLPEDTIKRSKIQQYAQWVREKRIISTPGAMTDYKYIEDDIKLLNASYPIAELAFDSHEATYLVNNIMEWLGQEKCIEINQGPALISEPMKQLEGLVYAGKIHHDGDPVLSWMISNVVLKPGRNSGPTKFYYPTKTSNDNKIDGAVALIMAVGRAMLGGGVQESAYAGKSAKEIVEMMSF